MKSVLLTLLDIYFIADHESGYAARFQHVCFNNALNANERAVRAFRAMLSLFTVNMQFANGSAVSG